MKGVEARAAKPRPRRELQAGKRSSEVLCPRVRRRCLLRFFTVLKPKSGDPAPL